ncbi:hypothetical protein, partial [Pseudomonas sp. Sample_16]|uniref:hypothetical protein n=1 Tax=Pseudomonas sp. Sample_16 TaxID=2448263 RepID=UPI0019D5D92B
QSLPDVPDPCRSEPAREKRLGDTDIQIARVIVNDHREQAHSYTGWFRLLKSHRPQNLWELACQR